MTTRSRSGRPLVHVLDDDEAVRRSLTLLLRASGYEVAAYSLGEALLAALADAPRNEPMCAIVDIRLEGGMDGLAVQGALAQRTSGPPLPVIIVSGHADVPIAVQAMRAGAVDCIEKPYLPDQLVAAVERALDVARRKLDGLASVDDAAAKLALLTAREREVLEAMVAGRANKEIARELGISPRTVEAHRAALMDRLSARSLAEVLRIALAARS